MHFCTAMVRLGGDVRNIVPRGPFRPVSWPEIEVLRFLHGSDAVTDVVAIAKVTQSAKAEKERLRLLYSAAVLDEVFPGKNPQMELEMPGAKLPDQPPLWANPIEVDPATHGNFDPTVAHTPKPVKTAKQLPFN